MISLRHILHPIHSAKSLNRHLVERRFRSIRRGRRRQCWCGGKLLEFKWHVSYGVCSECGCYVNRRPPLQEELKNLYSYNLYWKVRQRLKGYPTIEKRGALYSADGRLDYWLRLVERFGLPKGRVIEIGCAPGILLKELNKRGYECIGVEVDEKVAAWIHKNMGVDVRVGLFPLAGLPNCDLFMGFDVIEHSARPDEFMCEAARLLVSGGIVIIQTPIECHNYEQPFLSRPDFFEDIEHLVLFTDRAMFELGSRAGLKILTIDKAAFSLGGICIFEKS